jgi:TPR repeat protein
MEARAEKRKAFEEVVEQQRRQEEDRKLTKNYEMQQRLFEFRKEQADRDMPTTQFNLGKMYMNGEGCDMNKELGMTYIQKAATNGCSEAAEFLRKLK